MSKNSEDQNNNTNKIINNNNDDNDASQVADDQKQQTQSQVRGRETTSKKDNIKKRYSRSRSTISLELEKTLTSVSNSITNFTKNVSTLTTEALAKSQNQFIKLKQRKERNKTQEITGQDILQIQTFQSQISKTTDDNNNDINIENKQIISADGDKNNSNNKNKNNIIPTNLRNNSQIPQEPTFPEQEKHKNQSQVPGQVNLETKQHINLVDTNQIILSQAECVQNSKINNNNNIATNDKTAIVEPNNHAIVKNLNQVTEDNSMYYPQPNLQVHQVLEIDRQLQNDFRNNTNNMPSNNRHITTSYESNDENLNFNQSTLQLWPKMPHSSLRDPESLTKIVKLLDHPNYKTSIKACNFIQHATFGINNVRDQTCQIFYELEVVDRLLKLLEDGRFINIQASFSVVHKHSESQPVMNGNKEGENDATAKNNNQHQIISGAEVTEQIAQAACGALRNLTYGDNIGLKIKKQIIKMGGLDTLVRLFKRSTDNDNIREIISAILWNISGHETLKASIIIDGISILCEMVVNIGNLDLSQIEEQNNNNNLTNLSSLYNQGTEEKEARNLHSTTLNRKPRSQRISSLYNQNFIAYTFANWNCLSFEFNSVLSLFCNCLGTLRNISSSGIDVRRTLREYPKLIDTLIKTMQSAINTPAIDSPEVECCVCLLRNLSYKLAFEVEAAFQPEHVNFVNAHDKNSIQAHSSYFFKYLSNAKKLLINETFDAAELSAISKKMNANDHSNSDAQIKNLPYLYKRPTKNDEDFEEATIYATLNRKHPEKTMDKIKANMAYYFLNCGSLTPYKRKKIIRNISNLAKNGFDRFSTKKSNLNFNSDNYEELLIKADGTNQGGNSSFFHSPVEATNQKAEGCKFLWHPSIVKHYLNILKDCSYPITIEAAIGSLQNITSGNWIFSGTIRTTVRREKGLPLIIENIKSHGLSIAYTACQCLKNLAIDERNKYLIGKYAIQILVEKLPKSYDWAVEYYACRGRSQINNNNSKHRERINSSSEASFAHHGIKNIQTLKRNYNQQKSKIHGGDETTILTLERHGKITGGQNTILSLNNLICSILTTIRQLILKNHENAEILRNCLPNNLALRKIFNITQSKDSGDNNSNNNNFPEECQRAAAQCLCTFWSIKSMRELVRRDGWDQDHFLHPELLNHDIPRDITMILQLSNLLEDSNISFDNNNYNNHTLLTKNYSKKSTFRAGQQKTKVHRPNISKPLEISHPKLIQNSHNNTDNKNKLPSPQSESSHLPESVGTSTLSFHGLAGPTYRNWSLRSRKNINSKLHDINSNYFNSNKKDNHQANNTMNDVTNNNNNLQLYDTILENSHSHSRSNNKQISPVRTDQEMIVEVNEPLKVNGNYQQDTQNFKVFRVF